MKGNSLCVDLLLFDSGSVEGVVQYGSAKAASAVQRRSALGEIMLRSIFSIGVDMDHLPNHLPRAYQTQWIR